jgi:epsin
VPVPTAGSATTSGNSTPFGGLSSGTNKPAARTGGAGGDAFASLLSGSSKKSATTGNKGLTIADMAKQKTQAGLYGAPAAAASPAAPAKPSTGSSGLDDLLG